jgi:peroxiredoxin family protein
VQRVCGDNDQCSEVPACGLARQLLEMENEDRAKSEDPRGMTYSSGQCKEADKDRAYFQLCTP